jgi:hypothetical protein
MHTILQQQVLGRTNGLLSLHYSLATSWAPEGSELDSRQGQDLSPLHVIQTGSGAHPAFHPMGIGGEATVE